MLNIGLIFLAVGIALVLPSCDTRDTTIQGMAPVKMGVIPVGYKKSNNLAVSTPKTDVEYAIVYQGIVRCKKKPFRVLVDNNEIEILSYGDQITEEINLEDHQGKLIVMAGKFIRSISFDGEEYFTVSKICFFSSREGSAEEDKQRGVREGSVVSDL
ncbi:MAG: hypothetical protein H7A51_02395 [Akkermansiaceae bacterium]|nr:hypothetical protein [Akkermansiaceae bacterium]